jgi:hypothetical protein
MSRLFVVDPDLGDVNFGHHVAGREEIGRAADELGIAATFYSSNAGSLHAHAGGEQDAITTAVVPTFSMGTYLPDPAGDERLESLLNDTTLLDAEYATVPFHSGDCVLVTTASPWHLVALSKRLSEIPNLRIAIGMLLPPGCWTRNPRLQARVDSAIQASLAELMRHQLFVYSETGVIKWPHRTVPTQVLLQPVSEFTLQHLTAPARNPPAPAGARCLRFGFFGQPRSEKGFDLLLDALRTGAGVLREGREIRFYLPEIYGELAEQINQHVPGARAEARSTDNQAFLADMASVDVVLCFYDSMAYADQMSGIAAEAVLLGKPVLATRNTALEGFLTRHAPGASVAADFTAPALLDALNAEEPVWRQRTRAAQASSSIMRELKSARRFFRCAFDLPTP